MFRKLTVLTVALFFLIQLCGAANAEATKLSYEGLKQGDVSKYRMVIHTKTSIGALGQVETMDSDSEMDLVQRIIDKDAKGTLYILNSIENIKVLIEGVPVDAKNQEKVFTVYMEPTGRIQNTHGLENNFNQMQLVFPDKPVEKGTTWTAVISASEQVPTPLEITYTVEGFAKEGSHNCVVLKSRVVSRPADPKAVSTLDVKADGKIYFDYSQGRVVKNAVVGNFGSVVNQTIENKLEPIVTKVDINMTMELQ
jgi:hypothetical protein